MSDDSIDLTGCHWHCAFFGDGAGGAASQLWVCAEHPRLAKIWSRQGRNEPGKIELKVDGEPVADLDEATRKLALPEPVDLESGECPRT